MNECVNFAPHIDLLLNKIYLEMDKKFALQYISFLYRYIKETEKIKIY